MKVHTPENQEHFFCLANFLFFVYSFYFNFNQEVYFDMINMIYLFFKISPHFGILEGRQTEQVQKKANDRQTRQDD